jgi:hypothetical protein
MKEFAGVVANRSLGQAEGGMLFAYSDISIITSEIGHYERSNKVEEIHFRTTREGLKEMIGLLQRLEADLQNLEKRVTIEPKPNVEAD